jgi:FAD/FMN-containing dehydrogenase
VVLADGRVVTASATSNPDLFFAIRGGGGNYGVVTSWEYEVTAVPKGPVTYLKYEWRYTDDLKAKGYDQDIVAAFNGWAPWKLSKRFAFVELFLGEWRERGWLRG